jgi:cellulose biosynthesis protein BcsQ
MIETLTEQFPDLALLPAIPLSVKSAESAAERTSILDYMPRSTVAVAYREVARWIEEHPPGVESPRDDSANGRERTLTLQETDHD